MLQRLTAREGQTAEQARAQFDHGLGVSGWATPGRETRQPDKREENAPWWWQGDEEASQSFLSAMGMSL